MKYLIDMRGVSKRFGTHWAVRDLDLAIPPGELFGCLGPNGAGKTTTIKMLAGLLRPTAGTVLVAGGDMARNSEACRRQISYIPDEPHLYEKLSGREFLQFTRDVYGIDLHDAEVRMARLIGQLELGSYIDDLAETYSHGMRQRVAFAAALLHEPKVLIVDEPMVGLDPKSVRIVKDLLRGAASRGAAIFMSTHTLAVAEELADRIGIFHQGRLIRCGTLDRLKQESQTEGSTLEGLFLHVTS
ncbi:MAG: ABC transporter ATP-binding protein [Pirellulales bacterium]